LKKTPSLEDDFEINIPLINFAEDLATLFFTELRHTKISQTFDNPSAKFFYKSLSDNMIDYEVTKKHKIKIGVFLVQILLRNLTFEVDKETKNPIKKNVLKLVQKRVEGFKTQNFISIEKEFVLNYYVNI